MSETVRNVQQWCPTAETVVVLTVKGKVQGNLIEGVVADCNRYECKQVTAKSFCWVGRRILTAMW